MENIKIAEIAFNNDCYNASANRAYYAAFHAAIAALYNLGIEPKIDHKVVQSLFSDNYFNRRKVIAFQYKGYLKELQGKRNIADYREGVTKKVSKTQLSLAKELVEIILRELE